MQDWLCANFRAHDLSRAVCALVQCFEGMKAYVDSKGRARLFRPELNAQRFNKSMARLGMPVCRS